MASSHLEEMLLPFQNQSSANLSPIFATHHADQQLYNLVAHLAADLSSSIDFFEGEE
jgi:hypothetical protein